MQIDKLKLIVVFSCCFSFVASAFVPGDVADAMKYLNLEKYTSTENSARVMCGIDETQFQSDINNYGKVCNHLISSELCQGIDQEELVSCSDYNENRIDVTSWSFIKNCGSGLWDSFVELLEFIKDAVIWMAENIDTDTRNERLATAGEYYDSIANYISLEIEKERPNHEGEWFAETQTYAAVAGNIFKKGAEVIGNIIKQQFTKLGCYEPERRTELLCKAVGDVVMPPAFAVGLIVKGPLYLQKSNKLAWLASDKLIQSRSPAARSARAVEQQRVADEVALNLHTRWREDFIASNEPGATRPKPLPDSVAKPGETPQQTLDRLEATGVKGLDIENGKVVQDINRPADEIVYELNMKLNGDLAQEYSRAIVDTKFFGKWDVENKLDDIHKIWMDKNSWQADGNALQFRDFTSLPPSEKIKDLAVLEEVLRIHNPKLLESRYFIKYKEALEKAVADEAKVAEGVAQTLHTTWREGFLRNNKPDTLNDKKLPDEVIKSGESIQQAQIRLTQEGVTGVRVVDGKLVQNINQPADRIHPLLNNQLNGAPAVDYAKIVTGGAPAKNADDVARMNTEVHEAWMRHNPWLKDSKPELFRPYDELAPSEQLKDLAVLEQSYLASKGKIPKALKSERKRLEKAVKSENNSVSDVARTMHTNWRENYLRTKGNERNPKPVPAPDSDLLPGESIDDAVSRLSKKYEGISAKGEEIVQDINLPAEQIVPSLNLKLNGGPAGDYVRQLYNAPIKNLQDVERELDGIHQTWMKHNSWQKEGSPDLFRDYADLPADEQIKDLDVLESTLSVLRNDPETADLMKSYRTHLEGEIAADIDWVARNITNQNLSSAINKNSSLRQSVRQNPRLFDELAKTPDQQRKLAQYLNDSPENGRLLDQFSREISKPDVTEADAARAYQKMRDSIDGHCK